MNFEDILMISNGSMAPTSIENSVTTQSFQEYLGMSFNDLVLSCFLEQSAKYLGVYCEQDPLELRDDKYLIN